MQEASAGRDDGRLVRSRRKGVDVLAVVGTEGDRVRQVRLDTVGRDFGILSGVGSAVKQS